MRSAFVPGATVAGVRWEELFADIESQFERQLDAERLDLEAETERLRIGRLSLIERLERMSGGDMPVRLVLVDAQSIEMSIESTGADWIAGEARLGERRRATIVPIGSVAEVVPHGRLPDRRREVAAARSGLAERIGFAVVLRDLCRRRVEVDLCTLTGIHHGTIDRVGTDHLDLAIHGPGERRSARERARVVAFAGIVCVRI